MKKSLRRIYILFSFFLVLVFSCNKTSPSNYRELVGGASFKYEILGDDAISFKEDDTLLMNFVVSNLAGKRLVSPMTKNIVFGEETFSKAVDEVLNFLNEGDSVSVLLPLKGTFFEQVVLGDTIIKLSFSVRKAMTSLLSSEENEKLLLQEYLRENNISAATAFNDVYIIREEEGIGSYPEKGNRVKVSYTGFLLSGEEIESTDSYPEGVEFVVGRKEHMLPGFELGIKRMKQNGKAKIIISSQLAYGDKGSSTRIVPPFATLIYEVELIEIIKE